MAFRVEIAARAFNGLDEIADYIKRNGSFRQVREWSNGIIDVATGFFMAGSMTILRFVCGGFRAVRLKRLVRPVV